MKTAQKTKLLRQWNTIKDCVVTHPYARWYVSDPEAHPDCEALGNHTYRVDGWALATANDGADNLALSKKKAFMYGVYNVFMHTKENSVTVESIPVDLKTGKPIKTTAIQGTVSRERALEVLKKYSSAQSFDDLVETKPNDQYRVIGMSSSKVYDEFAYGLKNQDAIISALLK